MSEATECLAIFVNNGQGKSDSESESEYREVDSDVGGGSAFSDCHTD